MALADWEEAKSAFSSGAVVDRDNKTLLRYLLALANQRIENQAIQHLDIIRANWINHVLLQRHTEALDQKNAKLQRWFLIFAVASLIASAVQIAIALVPLWQPTGAQQQYQTLTMLDASHGGLMFNEIFHSYAMSFVIGYFVAVFGGQAAISNIVNRLYAKIGLPNDQRYGASISMFLGTVEMVLYVGAFQIERPEFIALWLGLKTVTKWRHWESDIPVDVEGKRALVLGRMAYNLFLLGNALVVLFAAVGSILIDLSSAEEWSKVIALTGALLVGSIALAICARRSREYPPILESDVRLAQIHKGTG